MTSRSGEQRLEQQFFLEQVGTGAEPGERVAEVVVGACWKGHAEAERHRGEAGPGVPVMDSILEFDRQIAGADARWA